jgi:hypothetical protein
MVVRVDVRDPDQLQRAHGREAFLATKGARQLAEAAFAAVEEQARRRRRKTRRRKRRRSAV